MYHALGGQVATYVKLLRCLAEGGVVLLDEEPSNLVLAEVAVTARLLGSSAGACKEKSALGSSAAMGAYEAYRLCWP